MLVREYWDESATPDQNAPGSLIMFCTVCHLGENFLTHSQLKIDLFKVNGYISIFFYHFYKGKQLSVCFPDGASFKNRVNTYRKECAPSIFPKEGKN